MVRGIALWVGVLFLLLASLAGASEQQCVGPIVVQSTGVHYFDFGYQGQGNNEVFTVSVVKTTGTISAQIKASLEPYGCQGGTNAKADCTVPSQCPGGTCYVSSGLQIPVDRYTGTALAAITATGMQQFDGPWNTVAFQLNTCTLGTVSNGCSIIVNICGKDL